MKITGDIHESGMYLLEAHGNQLNFMVWQPFTLYKSSHR